jgi:hypothetical protein
LESNASDVPANGRAGQTGDLGNPPPFIINTVIRSTLTDPEYQKGFLRYTHRVIDPSEHPEPHPKISCADLSVICSEGDTVSVLQMGTSNIAD